MAVVVVGLGELGSLLSQGLLRSGVSVVPVLRDTDTDALARDLPEPELVLVAVAEDDLAPVLSALPVSWKTRVALLQNELLPRQWQAPGIERPTVAVIWFEKKPGRVAQEILPSVLGGPGAPLLARALERLGLHGRIVDDERELLRALVAKNLYILTTNIAGLETGGSVRELWHDHRELARAVANDVLDLQQALCGCELPRSELLAELERAIDADPEHRCTGRSAPARLERALAHADRLGVAAPALRRIRQSLETE